MIPAQLVFVLALVVCVLALISARAVIRVFIRPIRKLISVIARRIIIPFFRLLLRPFARLARRFKVFSRLASPARQTAPAASAVPYKVLLYIFDKESLASVALGEVPSATKDLVKRSGIIFRCVNANQAAEQLKESLSLEDAQANVELSKKFYENTAESDRVSPGILYEDSEEALIIKILRESDLPFFWSLRALRRSVSRNIVRVLSIMTLIVGVFPFVIEMVQAQLKPLWKLDDVIIYGFWVTAFFASLMFCRYIFYANSARFNGQELHYFVQTYFSRLLNQYKSATAAFSNILNGKPVSPEAVEANSSIWFVNMHWISARQWLLGLYVRNIVYQFVRDQLWHLVLVPASIIVLWIALYLGWQNIADVLMQFGIRNVAIPTMAWGPATWLPLSALLIVYFAAWRGLLSKFWQQIRSQGWPSFRDMNIKQAIEDDIGPIVRELIDKRRNPMGAGSR